MFASFRERELVVFRGCHLDFLALCLLNALYILLSLGIYLFWAKVSVRKYMTEHTLLMDEPFEYSATGGERCRGFLKALPFLAAYYVLVFVFMQPRVVNALLDWGHGPVAAAIYGRIFVYGLTALVWLYLWPEVHVGRRRFELSRTGWRSVRFSFRGSSNAAWDERRPFTLSAFMNPAWMQTSTER